MKRPKLRYLIWAHDPGRDVTEHMHEWRQYSPITNQSHMKHEEHYHIPMEEDTDADRLNTTD